MQGAWLALKALYSIACLCGEFPKTENPSSYNIPKTVSSGRGWGEVGGWIAKQKLTLDEVGGIQTLVWVQQKSLCHSSMV